MQIKKLHALWQQLNAGNQFSAELPMLHKVYIV